MVETIVGLLVFFNKYQGKYLPSIFFSHHDDRTGVETLLRVTEPSQLALRHTDLSNYLA